MQENPFVHMTLTDYACQELLVSVAVGNAAGLSEFSPPAKIKFHNESKALNIKFAINR